MPLQSVSLAISESLRRLIPSLSQAEAALLSKCRPVESRAAPSNAHWQCNGALQLVSSEFSRYGQSSATRFAEKVVQDLNFHRPAMLERAYVSGPGYISITGSRSWLLKEVLSNKRDCFLDLKQPFQKILIDMSSPNIAKRMHVGHIRSTVIGEALSRLFKAQGHDVIKVNHVGDFGTQFGFLMAAIKFQKVNLEELDLLALESLYRFGKQNDDPKFLAESHQNAILLQSGDPDTLQLWEKIKATSRREYEEIYTKLGIKSLIERGESFYSPFLESTVSELLELKVAQYSNGAVCVFDESNDFPLIIRKSDGGFTYDTTDLAALRYRFQVDKADRVLYVVDHGQKTHFQKVFSTGRKAGWVPERGICQFVGFGVVLGPDGKRFSTSRGGAMNLSDLLETAVWKSKQMLIERCFQAKDLSLDDTSQAIGLSAVKYSDLNRHRNSNISFDVNAMLDFKGNTSVYLQYTRCRACKLLRDLNFESMNLKLDSNISDQECDDHERNLCVAILGYADALNEAASRLEPHIFCHYLYSLASSINSFYSQCPIIGNERQVIRARILQLAVRRLEDGFKILGLATIDHM